MTTPRITELDVPPLEAQAIRAAVRRADPGTLDPVREVARPDDAEGLFKLLSDPQVSGLIHDLPRPITREAMVGWIDTFTVARERGEGLLLLTHDAQGAVSGYSRITVWPERSAAELSGAIRADRQNTGQGAASAWRTVHWMFETLGVRLICLSAAADNIRSARLIEAMGFVRMGDRIAPSDDLNRGSLYWEMTREAWRGPSALS
jgi:RimJ/RimL family protein N-acetyltransferase